MIKVRTIPFAKSDRQTPMRKKLTMIAEITETRPETGTGTDWADDCVAAIAKAMDHGTPAGGVGTVAMTTPTEISEGLHYVAYRNSTLDPKHTTSCRIHLLTAAGRKVREEDGDVLIERLNAHGFVVGFTWWSAECAEHQMVIRRAPAPGPEDAPADDVAEMAEA